MMRLTDEELKALYRRRTARSSRGQAECLTDELLRRAVARQLTPEERERVINHLRTCSDCSRDHRIIHSAKQWASEVAPAIAGERTGPEIRTAPGRRPLAALWNDLMSGWAWRVGVLAAMLLIISGGSLIVWRAMYPVVTPPTERGAAGLEMKIDPPDRAQLVEAPRRFSWSEVKGAHSYQVALYDSEQTPIWEGPPVNATSVEIPDSIRGSLEKGRPIYWRVIINGGIERRQSDLFQFVLVSE